jgi:hypothetical protein
MRGKNTLTLKYRQAVSLASPAVEEWYSPDLPKGPTFQMEIQRWKDFCDDLNDTPKSFAESFVLSDPEYYPNIHEKNTLTLKYRQAVSLASPAVERCFILMAALGFSS